MTKEELKQYYSAYHKKYYLVNRERLLQQRREYVANHPDKVQQSVIKFYNSRRNPDYHKNKNRARDRQRLERFLAWERGEIPLHGYKKAEDR